MQDKHGFKFVFMSKLLNTKHHAVVYTVADVDFPVLLFQFSSLKCKHCQFNYTNVKITSHKF